jgi:competence protein ComEC
LIYLFSVGLIAGAWWLQNQALLPDLVGAATLAPLIAVWRIAAGAKGVSARAVSGITAALTFAVAGFFWAAAFAHWRLSDQLGENWEGRDVEVLGVVADMPQDLRHGRRFALDVLQVFTLGAELPERVSVAWYGPPDVVPSFRAGQVWRVTLRLHRPHGNSNPGGFDAEAWMLERRIHASGYIKNQPAPRLLSDMAWRGGYAVERLREIIREELGAALGERRQAGVIIALAIGDQRAIPADQWQVFTRTGVSHLLSVSGLHITMLAGLVFVLASKLWRRSAWLMLRMPAMRAATLAGFLAALAYALLSGFAVPAQRTVYMLAVVATALWFGWSTRPSAVLALAAALVVMVDPMAVISAGFWLSFGAVAIILLAGGGRMQPAGWLIAWARTQWAVTLALIPFMLAMFQQISLVSPLANAFAIPLVSLVVVPLSIAGALVPWDAIAQLAHWVMSVCMWPLEKLAALPGAVWQQHAPPPWAIPLAVAGAVWMLLPRGFPARWAGGGFLLPLFMSVPQQPAAEEIWLSVLDVGQGLAAVVRTREHALVFDSGPAIAERIDAGSRIVVPYLRYVGVRQLDALVISHSDLDHAGGALSVIEALPLGRLHASLPDQHPIRLAVAESGNCVAGQSWNWDGVRFEFLHPAADSHADPKIKDNDRSCVLRVAGKYGSVMLSADIERGSEHHLVNTRAASLKSDVLIAPHHGSRTSSTPDFLRAVAPALIVIPVGHRNRFGHPHPLVSARYRALGAQVYRTDLGGAISVKIGATGIDTYSWRDQARRYWRQSSSGTESQW